MTNRTQALGRRLIGALHNENIMVVISSSTGLITVCNAKTGKGIYAGYAETVDDFWALVEMVRSQPEYPDPKERTPRMTVKTHGAPKYVGISMGSFTPGKLSAEF